MKYTSQHINKYTNKYTSNCLNYLQLRNNIYYFRFRIPVELKVYTSKSEIVRSLKTDSYAFACDILISKIPLLEYLKRMTHNQTTKNELQELFDELTDFTKIDSYDRFQRSAKSSEIDGMNTFSNIVRESLQDNITTNFDGFIKAQPNANRASHKDFQRLFIQLVDAQMERAMNGVTPLFDSLLLRARSMLTTQTNTKFLLSEQYSEFKAFKQWNDKITKSNDRYYEFLIAHWGDICVTTVTKQNIKQALSAYEKMPKGNKAPYNKMSVTERYEFSENCYDDIIDSDIVANKSVKEVHKLLQSFFSAYLTKEVDILDKSPTDNVTYAPQDVKGGFYTDKEIQMFEAHVMQLTSPTDHWKKWMILLAIYTGARASESIKFLRDGAKEYNGIHYFELTEGKTDNAIRKVPVHNKLIKAGILDLPPIEVRDKAVTNYTNQLRDQLKISKFDEYGNKRVYHSFRHTFITKAISKQNTPALVQEIVGHSKQIGVTERYIHKLSLAYTIIVVNSVTYEN